MTRLEKLESEIQKLGRGEFATLRDWFRKYDADEWDRQIEQDVRGGGKQGGQALTVDNIGVSCT
jgi:hypothetical protein